MGNGTVGLTEHAIVNKGCVLKLNAIQNVTDYKIIFYPFAK